MKMRVLIVDDEPSLAELIQAVLATAGFDARVQCNSVSAAGLLETEKFDVVFLDVRMPAPDGIELARRMRAGGFNQNTPLVMITGEDELAIQKRAFEAGANYFLFKPIDRQRLLRVIRVTQAVIQREKRRFQRVGVSCRVSLATKEQTIEGTTLDLSLGGLLAQAASTFSPGAQIAVFLHLGSGGPIRARGRVTRVLDERRMGIQLEELSAAESERIQEFLLPLILKADS